MLNDCVHAARFVTKTNTTQVETFKSADQGSLGQLVNGQVYLCQASAKTHPLTTDFSLAGLRKLPSIDIIYDHQDACVHVYADYIHAAAPGIGVAASRQD